MLTEYSECRGTVVIKHFNFGTLKDNHDRACRTDILYELQKMQCVSLQESVWGTSFLVKLESIKKEVDTNDMFKYFRSVGYEHEQKCV